FALWALIFAGKAQEPRTIHVLVALADNYYQGIVPVPDHLGNGQNPSSNLYWGAMYGVRTFFSNGGDWELLTKEKLSEGPVLERLVFKHVDEAVFMVADAYDGQHIAQATFDYFRYVAGYDADVLATEQQGTVGIGGSAKLVNYLGHNGLMDFQLEEYPVAKENRRADAMAICCVSKDYFSDPLQRGGARSVLLTTGLMAPEAYVLEAVLQGWVWNETPDAICERAANAYDRYQHCGINGARRLFTPGW
ncbi:MAG: hypothetical protein ACFB10_07020, partial [Salibacteraceae bacterium]